MGQLIDTRDKKLRCLSTKGTLLELHRDELKHKSIEQWLESLASTVKQDEQICYKTDRRRNRRLAYQSSKYESSFANGAEDKTKSRSQYFQNGFNHPENQDE